MREEGFMLEPGLGDKISWFLYRKGSGKVKPEYLYLAKIGDPEWFGVVQALIKDKNLEGRREVLSQLLQPRFFKGHPQRKSFLGILSDLLRKGILDERRQIAKFLDKNILLFSTKDEVLYGALITAQRDSDITIANTAESAVSKLKGDSAEPL
jgi:hypothetical protein